MGQSKKNFLYVVAALAVLGIFWGALYIALRKNTGSSPPTPTVALVDLPQPAAEPVGAAQHAEPGAAFSVTNAAANPDQDWLGIELGEDLSSRPTGGEPRPVKVLSVAPGSVAAKSNMHVGDVIIGFQGNPPTTAAEMTRIIQSLPLGKSLDLELLRSGQPQVVSIKRGVGQPQVARVGGRETVDPEGADRSATGASLSSTGVFINNRELSAEEVRELQTIYGTALPPNRYWYDARAGLFGVTGREAGALIRTGHDLGPLASNSSNGNTGVFINGREINRVEAMYCKQLFGAVYQGRYWMDGTTGNMGVEGNPTPLVNVFAAIRQSQQSRQGGYGWHSNVTGAYGNSQGGCSYVSIPGSGTVSSGCD